MQNDGIPNKGRIEYVDEMLMMTLEIYPHICLFVLAIRNWDWKS